VFNDETLLDHAIHFDGNGRFIEAKPARYLGPAYVGRLP
jgi:hypothetical protein